MLNNSLFFGVVLSLLGYLVGMLLQKKFRLAVFNPLLIAVILCVAVVALLPDSVLSYEVYAQGGNYISFFLTPATVCLAIPLYQQLSLLKENWWAILGGILAGVLASVCSVLGLSLAFGLSHQEYVTLLPKSITTAIGMAVSEDLGGIVPVTVVSIVLTGVFGNMIAETVCKLFRIRNPIARGIGIGSAAHAIGTSRAIQMGEVEGAMSGLALAISGLLTVVGASIFAEIM